MTAYICHLDCCTCAEERASWKQQRHSSARTDLQSRLVFAFTVDW